MDSEIAGSIKKGHERADESYWTDGGYAFFVSPPFFWTQI
jgi:hypothetical protein